MRLPHPSTLRRWASNVYCQPGFLQNVLDAATKFSEDDPNNRFCSLIVDEMALRQQCKWNSSDHRYSGLVDFGGGPVDNTVASQALVLMLVGLKGRWKAPIGFFFTSHVNGNDLANVIKTAICKAADNGLIVKAIVSDGLSANMKAAKLLGCDLNHRTPRTYFQHPHPKHKEQKIFFICDAAHMLKLMRNLLDERKCLLRRLPSNETVIISWKYIEKLHELQSNESLYLANKLSGRHVNYSNVKMKVNIAAQTLSSSVAQAIAFLRDEMRHPEFAGSEATCHFIMIIDRLFDILNSKNPYAKGFKGALSEITKLTWKPSLLDSCQYLSSLCESDGTSIFDGKKSQGPLGFIVTATSVLQLADELLKEHNFQYFLTYKLSQDHLEVFFSKIRRRGGWNNNPNTEQFCAAYRAIIMNDSISVSSTGNSSNLDGTREIQVNLHSISQKASSTSTLDDLNADFAFVNVVDQMNSFF